MGRGRISVLQGYLAHKKPPPPYTAVYGRLEIVKRLHEAGADICAVTDGGLTAMDWGKVLPKAFDASGVDLFGHDSPGIDKNCTRNHLSKPHVNFLVHMVFV